MVGAVGVTVPTGAAVPACVHAPADEVMVAPMYGLEVNGKGLPQLPPSVAPPEQSAADERVTFDELQVELAGPVHWQALASQSRESLASA